MPAACGRKLCLFTPYPLHRPVACSFVAQSMLFCRQSAQQKGERQEVSRHDVVS